MTVESAGGVGVVVAGVGPPARALPGARRG